MKKYRVPIPEEVRNFVLERDGHACTMCPSTIGLVLHHVIFYCDGGSDEPENLAALCAVCHAELHERTRKSMFQRLSARKVIRRERDNIDELEGRMLSALYGQDAFPCYLWAGIITIDFTYPETPYSDT